MKTIGFMVIGCLFWTLIAIQGVYSVVPLIPVPTTHLITGTRTITPIIHTSPRIPTSCPNLYSYNSAYKKCYYRSASQMGFIAANDTCVNSGGSLVIAKTNDELLFLAQMIPGPIYTDAWIAVTYRTINGIDNYYWFDGTPFTLCTYGLTQPYSENPFLGLEATGVSSYCTTNWDFSRAGFAMCQATPF